MSDMRGREIDGFQLLHCSLCMANDGNPDSEVMLHGYGGGHYCDARHTYNGKYEDSDPDERSEHEKLYTPFIGRFEYDPIDWAWCMTPEISSERAGSYEGDVSMTG